VAKKHERLTLVRLPRPVSSLRKSSNPYDPNQPELVAHFVRETHEWEWMAARILTPRLDPLLLEEHQRKTGMSIQEFVMRDPPKERDFWASSKVVGAAFSQYLNESIDPAFLHVCRELGRLLREDKVPGNQEIDYVEMALEAALVPLRRLRRELDSRLRKIAPDLANWLKRVEEWKLTVEPGWVRILRNVADAVAATQRPMTQEKLARFLNDDPNTMKRPLAHAVKFGLLDKYLNPRGYWPSYLKPDPSWVRSVRTK
jgi:hypothetical protein